MTKSQQVTFKVVLAYICSFKTLPTLRDLAKELGYASHSTVQQHIDRLIYAGYLERNNLGDLCIPINKQTAGYLKLALADSLRQIDAVA